MRALGAQQRRQKRDGEMSELADAKIHGHGVARRVHAVHRSSEKGGRGSRAHYRVPTPASTAQSARRINIHAPAPLFKKKKKIHVNRPFKGSRIDRRRLNDAIQGQLMSLLLRRLLLFLLPLLLLLHHHHTKKEAAAPGPTRIIYPATNQEAAP